MTTYVHADCAGKQLMRKITCMYVCRLLHVYVDDYSCKFRLGKQAGMQLMRKITCMYVCRLLLMCIQTCRVSNSMVSKSAGQRACEKQLRSKKNIKDFMSQETHCIHK
jgi:hypothetical protein